MDYRGGRRPAWESWWEEPEGSGFPEMISMAEIAWNARRSLGVMALLVVAVAGSLLAVAQVSAQSAPPRDFFGTVLSVNVDTITISADDSEFEVVVDGETVITLSNNPNASITAVAEGDKVAVSMREEGSSVADKLFVIPGKTLYRQVTGTVSEVAESEITLEETNIGTESITFSITSETKLIERQGAELGVGAKVIVVAVRDLATGELQTGALEINVVPRPAVEEEPAEPPSAEGATEAVITGVLEGVDRTGFLVVSGTEIRFNRDTVVSSGLAVGRSVEVDAVLLANGTLIARVIARLETDVAVANRTKITGPFEGVDEQGNWIISGVVVKVGPEADTDGLPSAGQKVRVDALQLEDGTLVAREIENQAAPEPVAPERRIVELDGVLRRVDAQGRWVVNGVRITVNSETELEGTPRVGSRVKVRAALQPDRTIVALAISAPQVEADTVSRTVEFKAVVRAVEDDGTIVVGQHRVQTNELTEIDGELTAGATVAVKAVITSDKTLIARTVEVQVPDAQPSVTQRRVDIDGVVERVGDDGSLLVNGIKITTDDQTESSGDLSVGSSIKIAGVLQRDGSVLARQLKGENRRATQAATDVKVEGPIQGIRRNAELVPTAIVVTDTVVRLRPVTNVSVRLRMGVQVTVLGGVVEGEFFAREIRPRRVVADEDAAPKPVVISGVVREVRNGADGRPNRLNVNGVDVRFTDGTRVQGVVEKGVAVRITGVVRGDQLIAASIVSAKRVVDEAKTNSPTATTTADALRTATDNVRTSVR